MNEAFETRVPYSQDAEAGVLGAMLMDPDAIAYAVESNMGEDFFYIETHRKLFKTIIALYEKSVEVDPITLSDQLKKDGVLEEIGGVPFVFEISGSVPTSARIKYHAKIVREQYILRELINRCTSIIREAQVPVDNIDEFVDLSEEKILQIQDFRTKGGFVSIKPLINEMIADLESRAQKDDWMLGLPTGFKALDNMIGGLQNSDLIVVAGRPSTGKTSLALNISLNVAGITIRHPNKVPVGIFSLEMSRRQVVQRLICCEGSIDLRNVRTAQLTDFDWTKITAGANDLYEAPILIDESFSLSVLELRAKARRMHKQEKIGLLIVDYLQLMTARTGERSREQEVSCISRSLKALAKELDIPVMALSQLSRAVESRTDRRPRLSDLRESGAIEQDADLVLMLFRPELADIHNLDNESTEGLVQVDVSKNRNGPIGRVNLHFIKEYTRFSDRSKREEPSLT